jgi:TPR repeat protein
MLGKMYCKGKGVTENQAVGMEWLLKADAMNNNNDAQFELGRMFRDGDGVKKNEITALKWFMKAAKTDSYYQFKLGYMFDKGDEFKSIMNP